MRTDWRGTLPRGPVQITAATREAVNLPKCPNGPDPPKLDQNSSQLPTNDEIAAHNRALFAWADVLVINLLSAQGAGKTQLLEATVDAFGHRYQIGVIACGLGAGQDAARARAKGVPVIEIARGQARQPDAAMIHSVLHRMDLSRIDLLFIENGGNPASPDGLDLGQDANVVLKSVTDGDNKLLQDPDLFRTADLVLMTKADLTQHVQDSFLDEDSQYVRPLTNAAPFKVISARQPNSPVHGLRPWLDWLEGQLGRLSLPAKDTP